MSRRMIKTTLVELLMENELSHVTVTNLCSVADINRSTFYSHYLDIYDVLEDMEEEFVQKVSFILGAGASQVTLSQMRDLVSYIDKHRQLYLALVKRGDIVEKCIEKLIKDYKKMCSSEEDAKYSAIIRYTVCGVNGIMEKWASEELELPYQELSILLYQMVNGAMKQFS